MTSTAVFSHSTARAGLIWCAVLTPRGPAPRGLWLAFQGFKAWLEPFELHRFQLIADELVGAVAVVESPGFGHDGSRLSPGERIEALRGGYRHLGERIATALGRPGSGVTLPDQAGCGLARVTGVLGYSMGCSLATSVHNALIPSAHGVPLVLVEPAGARRRSLRALTRAMAAEERSVGAYLAESVAVAPDVLPWDHSDSLRQPHRHGMDDGLLGYALTKGCLPDTLASRTPGQQTLVVRGRNSLICDAESVKQLIGPGGVRIQDVIDVDGGHGLWHSFPRVRELAGIVRERLGCGDE